MQEKFLHNNEFKTAIRRKKMELVTAIGIFASVLTAISLLPQLMKLIREKKPENVSLGMLLTLLFGVGLWIWYGVLKNDWIIIVSNSFSLLVNLATILLTAVYKKNNGVNGN